MPRIYLPFFSLLENKISIIGEKARYLTSVLRSQKGDELTIFDGAGNCLRTRVVKSGRKEVVAEVLEKFPCNLESPLNIVLAQGILKGEKMDLVVQKATELGVKEIIPVITERSQVRGTRKVIRWKKIAEEASRQSGRSVVPMVHDPAEFSDFLAAQASQLAPHGFIFYEEGGLLLRDAINRMRDTGYTIQDVEDHASFIMHHASNPTICILVGPEGGFTKEEVNLAKEKGLIVASLGKRILRAETAAISAITLVQFLFGDMG